MGDHTDSSIIFTTLLLCLSEQFINTLMLCPCLLRPLICTGVHVPLFYIGKCLTCMTLHLDLMHAMYHGFICILIGVLNLGISLVYKIG